MASNSFGQIFRITTWGESHGKAIGVVIDGCPAGLPLSEEEINQELVLRQPGRTAFVSPRQEPDLAQIYSGVFEGHTTGTPISILIMNHDSNPRAYEPIKDLLRPGHANFTYLQKYGIFDYRGGGRASARETACRVAAGAVAKKLLTHFHVHILSYMKEIGDVVLPSFHIEDPHTLHRKIRENPLFCPDPEIAQQMMATIEQVKQAQDSIGGIIETVALGIPAGWGDPVYEKLEGNLAKAVLTIPATKGFEIGEGFKAAAMRGSEHNDLFTTDNSDNIITATNHAGGTLGGIATGMPLVFRVAFKATSSIKQPQTTVTLSKEKKEFLLPEGSRHDPCVAIRAVPIIEAVTALVLADALLMDRCSRL